MKSEMVVCNVYKLFKNGTRYTKEGKKLERESIALRRDYAEEKNLYWDINGLWHEIDEEATDEFYEMREQARLERIKDVQVKSNIKNLLTDVIVQGAETVTSKQVKDVSDLDKAREEYKKVFGKKAFNGWDVDKINEKINEKK